MGYVSLPIQLAQKGKDCKREETMKPATGWVIVVVVLAGLIWGITCMERAIGRDRARINRHRYEVCVMNPAGECTQHILARRAYRSRTAFADGGYWHITGVDGRSYRISAPVVIKQIADVEEEK